MKLKITLEIEFDVYPEDLNDPAPTHEYLRGVSDLLLDESKEWVSGKYMAAFARLLINCDENETSSKSEVRDN